MSHSDEITKAIGAHGTWKQRLLTVIKDGKADVKPENVEPDNLCDFGKWINALPLDARNTEQFKKVQSLHAAFHKEAAKVLRLASSGQKAAAETCLGISGSYSKISSELTGAMMTWKKTIDN